MLDRLRLRLAPLAAKRRLLTQLSLLHFVLIASYTLARATRDATFLHALHARRLPYIYIAVAAWTALVSSAFARKTSSQRLQSSMVQALAVSAAALWIFVPLFHRMSGSVTSVAFYLWVNSYGLLLVSLFWMLVNESVNTREAKQLFGVIGAGGILGGMAGGAMATLLVERIGAEALLYIAGVLLLAAIPLVTRPIAASSATFEVLTEPARQRAILHDRYLRLIAIVFLLGGITAGLVDYQFKVAIEHHATDKAEIAHYLGIYYTILGVGALLLQVLASEVLLRRFGSGKVSLLHPAGLVLGTIASLIWPGVLAIASATRLYDGGISNSVGKSASEFLFFPLPAALRRRVKTFLDAVVDRSAEALAGLLIIALNASMSGSPRQIATVTLLFSGAWFYANRRLNRSYTRQLSVSLRKLIVDVEHKPVMGHEAQLIEEAHHLLESTFEKRALYAFELLESIDPEGLSAKLLDLLHHPAPSVRARALAKLSDGHQPVSAPLLEDLFHDRSIDVRAEAVRVHSDGYADSSAEVSNLLHSGDEAVRGAALLCLGSDAEPWSEKELEAQIDTFIRSPSREDRRAAVLTISRRPRGSALRRKLVLLLDDPDVLVRREALMASGASGQREFIPALIPYLGQPLVRLAARTGLVSYGNRAVGTLGDYLADDTVPMPIRREIPLVLAQVGTQEAANELLRLSFPSDAQLLLHLLKAQNKIRVHNAHVVFPRPAVREALEHEVQLYLRAHLHLQVWSSEPDSRAKKLLSETLEERLQSILSRMFRRLGLIYPAQDVFLGYRGFSGTSRRTRAQALDYLETLLLPEDRRLLLPLLEDQPGRRTAQLAETLYDLKPFTRRSSLEDLIHGGDHWLQACALFVIGTQKMTELIELPRQALRATHPLVQETAAWSLQLLERP